MSTITATNALGSGLSIVPDPMGPWPLGLLDPDPSASFEGKRDIGGGLFRFDFLLSGHPTLAAARVFGLPTDHVTWRSFDFVKVTYFDASGALALLVDDIGNGVASVPGRPKPDFSTFAEIGIGLSPDMDGDDIVTGNDFADRVHAFGGKDLIFGKGGDDSLFGNGGDDTIMGGGGNDRLVGNAGSDHFRFGAHGNGTDRIVDFNQLDGGAREGDRLELAATLVGSFVWCGDGDFTGGSDNSEARRKGHSVQIDLDGDGTAELRVVLSGLTAAGQISDSDFLFV